MIDHDGFLTTVLFSQDCECVDRFSRIGLSLDRSTNVLVIEPLVISFIYLVELNVGTGSSKGEDKVLRRRLLLSCACG